MEASEISNSQITETVLRWLWRGRFVVSALVVVCALVLIARCDKLNGRELERRQALAAKWGVSVNELTGDDAPFGYLYNLAQTSRSRAKWLELAEGANVRIECEWADRSKPRDEDATTEDILLFFSNDPAQAVKVAAYFRLDGTLFTGPFLLRNLDAVESSCPRFSTQG